MASSSPGALSPGFRRRTLLDHVILLPYFIYGGFVVPLVFHGLRTAFTRRTRVDVPHVLVPFILGYLLLNLWLVRPAFTEASIDWTEFWRWQVREIVPLLAIWATAQWTSRAYLDDYVARLLRVSAALAVLGIGAYIYGVATSSETVLGGLVVRQHTGEYLFTTWLRAHNAAGGLYAALSVVAAIRFLEKRSRFPVVAANLTGLAMTASRSAIAAAVAVTAFSFMRARVRSRLARAGVGAIVVLALATLLGPTLGRLETVLQGTDPSATMRIEAYQRGLNDFALSPLVGVGWGGYEARNYPTMPGSHTHNSYLQTLAELGLVGTALIGGWLVSIFVLLRKRGHLDLSAALATIAISSLAEHNWGSPSITAPIFILVGLAMGTASQLSNSETKAPRIEAWRSSGRPLLSPQSRSGGGQPHIHP